MYKAIVRPYLKYCIQARIPYHKNDIDTLEYIKMRATKIIPELRDHSYEERLKERFFSNSRDKEVKRRSDGIV